jgi:hypothetical protein
VIVHVAMSWCIYELRDVDYDMVIGLSTLPRVVEQDIGDYGFDWYCFLRDIIQEI